MTRWTEAGRLHRVHRGVYALGHAALSQEARWLAAVLAAGEGAALSHLPAAAHLKFWRRRVPSEIHVVSPSRREVVGVRVHRASGLQTRDVTRLRGVPVTTVPRLLVDLTDVLTPEQLANVIHEAAFRRRFDASAAADAMERANGRRRLRVLEAALAAHAAGSAGTKSDAEDEFLALLRAARLPEPLVNVRVETVSRRLEVDFHWPELRLCAEVDGDGHERPRTQLDDEARDELLRDAGWAVLRVTAAEVRHRPSEVPASVRAAMRSR